MSDGLRLAHQALKATKDPAPAPVPILFLAEITEADWPTCKIKPTNAATAGNQLVALCVGSHPKVGDRAVCAWIGGEPYVISSIAATDTPSVFHGTGDPEGVVFAPAGSVYLRNDGSTGTTAYLKWSGTDDTGWTTFPERGVGNPDIMAPPGLMLDTVNSAMASNSSYAIYMGKADRVPTSAVIRLEVMVAAATITWAEVAIATSPAFVTPASVNLTTRGFTSVSTAFNTTGEKTVTVNVSGIAKGDNLWLLVGSQATTPFQLQGAMGGNLSASQIQFVSGTRPSTMGAAKAFSSGFNLVGFYGLMTLV